MESLRPAGAGTNRTCGTLLGVVVALTGCFSEPPVPEVAGTQGGATTYESDIGSDNGQSTTGPEAETTEQGGSSSGPDTGVALGCGDGTRTRDEACDDHNQVDGDGCNADCRPSQEREWLWHDSSDVEGLGYGVAVLGGTDVYAAGKITSSDSGGVWLARFAPDTGELIWEQTTGQGGGADEGARSIAASGRAVVTGGSIRSTTASDVDGYLQRWDTAGTATEQYVWTGSAGQGDYVLGVGADMDSIFAVGQQTQLDRLGQPQAFLGRYTPALAQVAIVPLFATDALSFAEDVAVRADGSVCAAGGVGLLSDNAAMDGWVGCYDRDSLDPLWPEVRSDVAPSSYDALSAVAAAPVMADAQSPAIAVCGYQGQQDNELVAHVTALDGAGNVLWTHDYSGEQGDVGAFCVDVAFAPDGTILATGAVLRTEQGRQPFVQRLDAQGSVVFSKVMDVAPEMTWAQINGIDVGSDGHLFVTGNGGDAGVVNRRFVARLTP